MSTDASCSTSIKVRFYNFPLEISLRGKNGKRRTSFSKGYADKWLIEACGCGATRDNFILKMVPTAPLYVANFFASFISVEVDVNALQKPFYYP